MTVTMMAKLAMSPVKPEIAAATSRMATSGSAKRLAILISNAVAALGGDGIRPEAHHSFCRFRAAQAGSAAAELIEQSGRAGAPIGLLGCDRVRHAGLSAAMFRRTYRAMADGLNRKQSSSLAERLH